MIKMSSNIFFLQIQNELFLFLQKLTQVMGFMCKPFFILKIVNYFEAKFASKKLQMQITACSSFNPKLLILKWITSSNLIYFFQEKFHVQRKYSSFYLLSVSYQKNFKFFFDNNLHYTCLQMRYSMVTIKGL